jgi:GNAT superfamily N-acetyltransferase
VIKATDADRPAIEAFLIKHIATSMFPLSNLRRHGMSGGHPRAMTFWVWWKSGTITDIVAVSDEGMVFPQCPSGVWGEAAVVLAGSAIKGVLGHGGQVAALRRFLDLPDYAAGLDDNEPLYQMSLSKMQMPDTAGFTLRPLADAPRDLVIGWRRAYLKEVLPMPGEDFDRKAVDDVELFLEADSHRVLYQGDIPVAMTGFNAALAEAVQIGAVFTPPENRSQGLARRAVAMHLVEAQTAGVEHASLFAASPQACKTYEAIGFQRIGDFTILIYESPQVIYG